MVKVMIMMPDNLLEETDAEARREKRNRSQVIRTAVQEYLERRKCEELRERMIEGYQVCTQEDAKLMREFAVVDAETARDIEEY